MEGFWLGILTCLPSWFFSILAVGVLIGLGLVLWRLERGAKALATFIGSAERFLALQKEVDDSRATCQQLLGEKSKLETCTMNLQMRLNELNAIAQLHPPNALRRP